MECSTSAFEAATNLLRDVLGILPAGTSRSKRLHVSRKSSQLDPVECTAMRDRALISLTPVRWTPGMKHPSGGEPIGSEAGKTAIHLWHL